jgi:KDO2-lipid IV(A) lauroyltransferase
VAKLSHRLEYVAVRSFATVANLLSPRLADSFGSALGGVAHSLMSFRRQIAFDNIKKSDVGQNLSDRDIKSLVKRVFKNTGRTVIETTRFGNLTPERIKAIVDVDSFELIEQCQREGGGVITVSPHFGSWELLSGLASAFNLRMNVLIAMQHNPLVNDYMIDIRRKMGVGIIPLDKSPREIFKALNKNEIVGIVADQHAPSGIKLCFLGREALVPRGPALFSIRKNAPVCPFLIRREKFDKHVVMQGDLIYPPNSGDEEADIRYITEKYTRFFEDGIRKWPDQWLWTHRRWKIPEN